MIIDKGTKLEKRLARGDAGINPLDRACKEHDIAYARNSDTNSRYLADEKLQKNAMNRVFSKDASLGERATALAVSAAMKAKRSLTKLGKGIKKTSKCRKKSKRMITMNTLIKHAKTSIKKSKPENLENAIDVAVASIHKTTKDKRVKKPRIIKLPKITTGGVLPLIPVFAGLSALGSIVGSTAGVMKAINDYKEGQKLLEENKRHNREMETIAIGKGYYLQPYKRGKGYYLKPFRKN